VNSTVAPAQELAAAARRHFPGAHVHALSLIYLSPLEQMAILSRTTVLVSNIGSRSFRMIFLPDGAQVSNIQQFSSCMPIFVSQLLLGKRSEATCHVPSFVTTPAPQSQSPALHRKRSYMGSSARTSHSNNIEVKYLCRASNKYYTDDSTAKVLPVIRVGKYFGPSQASANISHQPLVVELCR
jgi:hypothetical protein